MDEIIDLEEVTVEDETLKEFMKKDDEAEKELNDKIGELAIEEEKLNKKQDELNSLEDENRQKISTNASADELIEIAGKIKELEEELSSIKENIDTLSKEKEELINTKNEIESSKKEYIKSLNQASSNYEEQLKKISEAIEVCDNPTLKQVLEDVQAKKNEELSELSEKRENELKKVLKEEETESKIDIVEETSIKMPEEEVKVDKIDIDVKDEKPSLEVPTFGKQDDLINILEPINLEKEEVPIEETKNDNFIIENPIPTIEVPEISSQPQEDISNDINIPNFNESINTEPLNDVQPNNEVINLDSILTSPELPELNVTNVDSLDIPIVNNEEKEDKIKIIYEKEVPNNLLKDIYSSSKIMPSLNNYLENKNEGSFM